MNYKTVQFIHRNYNVPEDLLVYIELLATTNDVRMEVNRKFYQILRNEEVGCIGDEQIKPEIDKQVGKYISKLLDNGIYDRTINDYLKDNKGFSLISKVNDAAFQKMKELLMQELDEYQAGVEDALYKRDSSITGMGFSILSGSFVNHAIYAAMEASTLNKQEAAANKEYQREIDALHSSVTSRHDGAKKEYIDNVYIPNMESAIAVFAFELLDTYISDLIKNGKLDKEVLNYINIDRSNDLLKNLDLSQNKEGILHKAFEACPYNYQVYNKVLSLGLMDYDTYQTAQYFKQGNDVMFTLVGSLGKVEYPKKFIVNYEAASKMAELSNSDVITVLRAKTKDYAEEVVNAYGKTVEILGRKDVAIKKIKELPEQAIIAGDAVSKGKATACIKEIVPQNVWNQLTERCGFTELLGKIKAQVPGAENALTKSEVDAILEEKLFLLFEEVRQELVVQIRERQEKERQERLEAERIEKEKQAKKAEAKEKAKKTAKKGIKILLIGVAVLIALFVLWRVWIKVKWDVIVPAQEYKEAVQLMEDGKYKEAYDIFSWRDDYKDSAQLAEECKALMKDESYNYAIDLMGAGEYERALVEFIGLEGYKDTDELVKECGIAINDIAYDDAVKLMELDDYEAAITAFEEIIDHKDSKEKIIECQNAINEKFYNEAISLADEGEYARAIDILNGIGNYKDSAQLVNHYKYLDCQTGDEIVFGTYEQDGNKSNGKEAIEWIVLDRKDDKALVISKYCIEQKPFNDTLSPVTWEQCTLRKWLNKSFYDLAFSKTEQSNILSTTLKNPDDVDGDQSGKSTVDKIFLLSQKEAMEYFESDSARKADATEYCSTNYCYWLLRSTGSVSNVAHVDEEGVTDYYENVDRNWWVRPAMWIKISK